MVENKAYNDVFSSLNLTEYFGLSIYTDTLTPNSLFDSQLWVDIESAYRHAYVRFCQRVWNSQRRTFDPSEFFPGKIVLTSEREGAFKDLYPSPKRFPSLPPWVEGYVNFKKSVFVLLVDSDHDYHHFNHEGSAHEFNHTIVPSAVGLPAAFLEKAWGSWLREAFSVGLHQKRPDGWLGNELRRRNDLIPPTLASIEERGIFYHDSRPPFDNVAYQYCPLAAESIGKTLLRKMYPVDCWGKTTPYAAWIELTYLAHKRNKTMQHALASLGIDIGEEERLMRRNLHLTY